MIIVLPDESVLPPDPAEVAPPLDQTTSTGLLDATAFLYTGENPIQTGVLSGTIELQRVAVLRGRVLTVDGDPLPGVVISVLDHPDFGQTHSRDDGMFDLAVNGGGILVVRYTKDGFLPVQRQVDAPWQDYTWLPDVALVPLDSQVTTIDLTSSAAMQVASGSVVSDTDGVRQATLLFPPGVQAEIVLPGGMTQTLTTLDVRATEYTAGERGAQSMPGELPPSSGYTYAAELSVDEALAAGALDVKFDRPVYTYIENFLDFPVGSPVPVGYYDRERGVWVASPDGRIIRILAIAGGLAQIDVDGSSLPADADALSGLGVTDAERQQLAQRYTVGVSLWRIPMTHFSAWDANWPFGPPPGGDVPPSPDPGGGGNGDPSGGGGGSGGGDNGGSNDDCPRPGSIIYCHRQVLGESIPIAGTDATINYSSDRVPGRAESRALLIQLSGPTLTTPAPKRIELEIQIAGRLFEQSFAPVPDLTTTFIWDGKDVYGREVRGWQPVVVRVGNTYDGVYQQPGASPSFARPSGVPISGSRTRQEVTLWSEWRTGFSNPGGATENMNGWSLSPQHLYDPLGGVLYLGDGGRRTYRGVAVIDTVAGGGTLYSGLADGRPATEALLSGPGGLAVGPDGSVFISESFLDFSSGRIRRIGPDGIITTFAGGGGGSGDGEPATSAFLYQPGVIALGPDGSLYIGEPRRIRRVGPDGIITIFAGNGDYCLAESLPCGDGGPATSAQLNGASGLAVTSDGSVYFASDNTVRRIGLDGIITTVAGTGVAGSAGEGGPANAAQLVNPGQLAVGPDSSLYIVDHERILRMTPDGILTRVAGGSANSGMLTESGEALALRITPSGIAVGSDGSIFFSNSINSRIYMVDPSGFVRPVAGSGGVGTGGDQGPATAAQLYNSNYLALGPDDGLYLASVGTGFFGELTYGRIRRVSSSLPGLSFTGFLIPSADGSEIYRFDGSGRHLRTLHALTGAPLYEFGYDGGGRLITITDGDGNIITIERNSSGSPTAIVGPYGQRTTLAVDANGYLNQITDPAGQSIQFVTTESGLLTALTDARGGVHHFAYDGAGRLIRDEDAAGNVTTLSRVESATAYTITLTSAGQPTIYASHRLPEGTRRLTTTFPDGSQSVAEQFTDGTSTIRYADGTQATAALAPDPRWGMGAPFVKSQTITTPEGRTQSTTRARQATLSDPFAILSLQAITESVTFNGDTVTSFYTAQTHQITTTSAAGRTTISTLDARGRVVQAQLIGLEAISFGYDSRGRVSTTSIGSGGSARTTVLSYVALGPAAGHLASVTDPLSRTTTFTYDAAGRAVDQTLPGGQSIAYSYDAAGNLTGVTPPGRAAHTFVWRADGQLQSYAPPSPSSGVVGAPTNYLYDLMGRLTGVVQADGQTMTLGYDASGRPTALSQSQSLLNVAHDPATGDVQSIVTSAGVLLTFGYDGILPRSETWSGPVAGSVSRTFDNALRTATRSVNSVVVTLEYDADGLLVQAGALALGRHPAHGMVISTTLGAVTDEWSYTGFGGLASYAARTGEMNLYAAQYTRDQIGRIVQESETISGVTTLFAYTYDVSGRLHTVAVDGTPLQSYTYDNNGNRMGAGAPASPILANYDGQDRLISAGTTTYTHTLNGEIQRKDVSGQTTLYRYDILGFLVGVTLPDGEQIEYILDGLGRRVGKRVDGVLVEGWLYDERARVVAELDGSGAVIGRFVYGSRPNTPDYLVRGAASYRIISNHLGSPRLVVNAADGAIVQRMDYDAYGNITGETLAPGFRPIPFGFSGGIYDRQTKLTRLGVREYDAETGRWMTRDPILFAADSTNLYAYASNDPINRRDVDGMDDEPAGGGVCIFPPAPLPGYGTGPIFLDSKPAKPEPPIKPLPSFADMQKERQKTQKSSGGGGGLTLGPFKFTPQPNTPSISDIREKDPAGWFDSFDLTIEAPIYPDFSLPPTPEESGSPDQKSPDTKPEGPHCAPKLDSPDTAGCEN